MKSQGQIDIKTYSYANDGKIPNHPSFSLLHYKNVFEIGDEIEAVLTANHWRNTWHGGVFDYHHYHSNSHEVLVVDAGHATLHVGGVQGEEVFVERGDVLILPAGFGHKYVDGSDDFAVIGAYPDGVAYDLCTGDPIESERNLQVIKDVPKPNCDPIYGERGPLPSLW